MHCERLQCQTSDVATIVAAKVLKIQQAKAALLPHDELSGSVADGQDRSLDFADRAQLATFAFQLWRDVDIDRAAGRLKTRMAEIARQIKEGMEAKAAEAARKADREAAWNESSAVWLGRLGANDPARPYPD
ncbi:MAG: hypothetical protein LAP61_29705 [Acidobacteriia bacterium]|nr:hypothetical protein [Terriglobia bacterium]